MLLCCPFMDLDAEIEARIGRSIADIFAHDGETEFRKIEQETLSDIISAHAQDTSIPANTTLILALGGGAVMTPECERMVHEQTVCVYLRTSVDELVARLAGEAAGRPLLGTQPGTEDSALRKETLYKG